MKIRAGFMGVEQDPKTLTLKPRTAWQVMHVTLSPEERQAVDYLSSLEKLEFEAAFALSKDFVCDPKSNSIKIRKGQGDGNIDSRFWRAALPLMHRLKSIDTSRFIGPAGYANEHFDSKKNQAVCEALLTAKSVTEVFVAKDMDPACLKILRSRKDWKVIMEGDE